MDPEPARLILSYGQESNKLVVVGNVNRALDDRQGLFALSWQVNSAKCRIRLFVPVEGRLLEKDAIIQVLVKRLLQNR